MRKSCSTKLLAFCDKATDGVGKGRDVHVVYLDLARPLTHSSISPNWCDMGWISGQ